VSLLHLGEATATAELGFFTTAGSASTVRILVPKQADFGYPKLPKMAGCLLYKEAIHLTGSKLNAVTRIQKISQKGTVSSRDLL
jgi:hypothetical protein